MTRAEIDRMINVARRIAVRVALTDEKDALIAITKMAALDAIYSMEPGLHYAAVKRGDLLIIG